jgi:hypothetical protein
MLGHDQRGGMRPNASRIILLPYLGSKNNSLSRDIKSRDDGPVVAECRRVRRRAVAILRGDVIVAHPHRRQARQEPWGGGG